MAGLATVIGRPIMFVHPPLNGLCDLAFRQLTCTIQPLPQTMWAEPVYIFWSRVGGYDAQHVDA